MSQPPVADLEDENASRYPGVPLRPDGEPYYTGWGQEQLEAAIRLCHYQAATDRAEIGRLIQEVETWRHRATALAAFAPAKAPKAKGHRTMHDDVTDAACAWAAKHRAFSAPRSTVVL